MPLLKAEEISYAVDGVLNIDSPEEYMFPTTRTNNPMSIMQQCHSIIRSKRFSAPIAEYSSQMHDTRKMVTLEAILAHVQTNNEWKPLNKYTNSTNNVSRAAIINAIRSFKENDFALSVLYDKRFVSDDSQFCPSSTPQKKPKYKYMHVEDVLMDNSAPSFSGKEYKENWKQKHVLEFGIDSRSIGDVDTICPCPFYDMNMHVNVGICTIHFVFCDFIREAKQDFTACNAKLEEDSMPEYIEYDQTSAKWVRSILDTHSLYFSKHKLQCHHILPSDLWGITSHEMEKIDGIGMLIHSKSGVTLGNLQHINTTFSTLLGESDRSVIFENEETTVKNILCGNATKNHKSISRLGFPVLSMIAESPAVVNCLRYIMEIAWSDILNKYHPITATSNNYVRELHAESNFTADMWHKRCKVKLNKLKTCMEQGAFAPNMITQADTMIKPTKSCPYDMQDTIENAALMAEPCLVTYDNKLYDPHLCVPRNKIDTTNSKLQLSDLNDNCRVFNPTDMLSGGTFSGVVSLPELSKKFVDDILEHDGDDSARKHGIYIYVHFVLFPWLPHFPNILCFSNDFRIYWRTRYTYLCAFCIISLVASLSKHLCFSNDFRIYWK
jgi:hypothetical protein